MSKQIYIDSNGNEIQVSGTVNTADMMPMSGNDSTKVSEAIGDLSTLTTTVKSSLVGAVNEVNSGKQDTAILHIKKDFANTYTIQTCIGAIITEYGKKTMAFGFVLTGSGWYEGMLSFYDNNQGGGYLVMNGGTPRLWAVAYQNGNVYISEK